MTNGKDGREERIAPPKRDVAVYLDFENLYVSLKTTAKMEPNFELLMDRCREFGRVTLCRAYADWSEYSRMFTSQMFANGIEPVYVPTRKVYDTAARGPARKNSVDIHLSIDIIKSLFLHENIDVIILISGDRDYVPLINEIRQKGKSAYAIGVAGCTSSELSIAVDEMFFYHQLLERDTTPPEQVDVYNQLLSAIRTARRRGYPTTLGILKPIMKELVEGFDERSYNNPRGQPFQKFKDLIQEAERRRLVKLVTTGGANEVLLWAEPSARAGASSDRSRSERGRTTERGRTAPTTRSRRSRRPERSDADEPGARDRGDANDSRSGESAKSAAPPPAPSGRSKAGDGAPGHGASESDGPKREASPSAVTEQVRQDAVEPPGPTMSPDVAWPSIQRIVQEVGAKGPTQRQLLGELKKARAAGEFGEFDPSDQELHGLIEHFERAGRLERKRRGFSSVLRLYEPTAESPA